MSSSHQYTYPVFEFHISRQSRDYYKFDQSLFSLSGNVVFANFRAVREFAHRMNASHDLIHFPEQAVKAGDLNAMGLIDEILHYVVSLYKQQSNPQIIQQALEWLEKRYGSKAVNEVIYQFVDLFPPIRVYRHEISPEEYLGTTTQSIPNRQISLEELLLLVLANTNPAFAPFQELFDDESLKIKTVYPQIFSDLYAFFDSQPKFGPDNQNLIDMLQAPVVAAPYSLSGQLEFILTRWASLLGERFLYRLLGSLDFITEETRIIFGMGGETTAVIYEFDALKEAPERYSSDKDWMPSLVLIAKHIYVWLDQLSKKFQRPITRLDQIPDEELGILAQWGFSGLWLIGIWERSSASQRIKQMTGNPEAVASAYSLFEYQIAKELGGDEAYQNLKERAWRYGIRLAADMVPNHMGIYSKWVLEHPDWFISLNYSPYPSYTFNGPNLSYDERVGIYLEDHYYTRKDAAVVFKRIDYRTGNQLYIYHGNDGTSMPWNDTAQLNYLKPEVREAVIQAILHVAQYFPIIRFDAAMTLTKMHYQRLWFPEPGTGGAIPSRTEFGLTVAQINAAMPEEFWREVVDRVAQEAPGTLLLAEAFWLLEGYFVRTLGMHRVYNSAFMNMLRDEKNTEYRKVIKNTLEFDPEILKRYVNFMNNPDERTAVDQFGKGDKYFGIALLMATLPGLPMFGHGQVEGFSEKYGMEYRYAYWNEQADLSMVSRHEYELAPLLHQRYLFADVSNFFFYDFYTTSGKVDENVFAYSNRVGDKRAIILYNNKYSSTKGWIRTSVAYSVKVNKGNGGTGSTRVIKQQILANGLALPDDSNSFTIFRDHKSGLEYIRNNHDIHEKGLFFELQAYQYYILLDFRVVQDNEWHQYSTLEEYLGGRGVPSVEAVLHEIFLRPIHYPFKELVNPGRFQWLLDNRLQPETFYTANITRILDEIEDKAGQMLKQMKALAQGDRDEALIAHEIRRETQALLNFPVLDFDLVKPVPRKYKSAIKFLRVGLKENPDFWYILLSWLFTHPLGKIYYDGHLETAAGEDNQLACLQARTWMDEWLLSKLIAGTLRDIGLDEQATWRAVGAIDIIISHQSWFSIATEHEPATNVAYQILHSWLVDLDVQHFLQVNRFQDTLWFNKKAFNELLHLMFAIAVIQNLAMYENDVSKSYHQIVNCFNLISKLKQAEAASGYQIDKLLEAASELP